MVKSAIKYYEVNPWKIIEKGFDPKRSKASESIFSLANEYMGVRGFFEETYSGETLIELISTVCTNFRKNQATPYKE